MLQLPGRGFKITVINMLRALMEKVDSVKEQMGNASWEVETLKKMLEIKTL